MNILFFIGLLSAMFLFSSAYAGPNSTTYQAKIIKPDGRPLEASSVNFRFTILDPSASCILYVEDYAAVDMSGGGGLISFTLGVGVRSFPVSGAASTFSNVFDNMTAFHNCQPTGTYNPSSTDNRKIVMQFQDSLGWQTLPAMTINAVPYAMYAGKSENATQLNGKADTAFVEYSTLAGLSCAADQAIKFNGVSFSCITVPVSGGGGITSVTTSGTVLTTGGTASAPVISIQAATVSQDGYLTSLDYAEFKAKLSASSTQIVNTLGYAPVSGAAVATQINNSNLSGDVSGTVSANSVVSVGGKSASQISTSVDDTLSATSSATADTIIKRNSSGNFTANDIYANAAKVNYIDIYKPSTSFNIRLQAPTSLSTNYVLNLPTTSGTTGQVLSTDGSGNLSWISPTTGSVVSVSATAPLASTGGSNPTISISQSSSSTDGYLSSNDFNTFNNKQTATSTAIIATLGYTPADDAVSGTYAQKANNLSDLASVATARTNLGLGTFATASSVDLGSVSATGIIAEARLQTQSNVTSGTQYTKVTVDGKGRVTSGAQLSSSDVITALGYAPANAASAGITTLNGSSSATQIFAIGTSGNSPAFNTVVGTHTLNIPLANTGSVTAGLLSNTDYTAFNNKQTATSAAIIATLGYTPADDAASGTYLVKTSNLSDLTNIVTARTNLGLGTFATASSVDLGTASATGVLAIERLPSFNGDATIAAASNTIVLSNSGVTAGTYTKLTVDAKGRVTSSSALASSDVTTALGYTPANATSATQWTTNGSNIYYNTGNIGVGILNPTAKLELALGTASVAPLKFTSGTLLSSAQSGTMEYDGFNFYLTDSTNTRRAIATGSSQGSIDNASTINSTGNITMVPVGSVIVSSTTASSNSNTGALVVKGGFGVAGNINAAGNLNVSGSSVIDGALKLSTITSGSVLLAGANGVVTQDNSALYWDGTNKRLGIGGNSPASTLSVSGTSYFSGDVGIGITTPVTKLDVSGAIRIGMDSATCSAGYAGTIRYNSGAVEMCNGTIWSAFGIAGAGVTNFNGSTSGTQSFAVGTTGTAPLFVTANGVHTLNIPYASVGTITAGLISNGDYQNFNNKITSSAASIAQVLGYTPASSSALVDYLVKSSNLSDLASSATARSNLGLGSIALLNSIDLGSAEASGTLAIARLPSFNGDATIAAASNTIILSNSGVTAGTYTKLTVDNKGRVTSSAALASNDVTTALGYTPASASASTQWTTSGTTINYMIGNVGIGTTTPTTKLSVSGGMQISMEFAACAASYVGTLRYNVGNVEYCNGTSWQAFGVSGAGITNFNGSTSGTQSFAIGSGGTAPNFATANGVHTLNLPLASTASVTAGLLSNTDYAAFSNKITSSATSIAEVLGYVPADNLVSGTYVQKVNNLSDLTNIATARTNLGLGTFATASTIDLGSASATGTLAIARLPSFTGDATIAAASNTIILSNSGITAGTYTKVTVDGKGRVTSGSAISSSDVTTALGYTPASATAASQWTTSGTTINYNTGNVGIGTTTPITALDVSGGIRIGAESTTCAPALAGTLRYNVGNVEYCNGTSWQSFGVSGAGITNFNGSTSGTQSFVTGAGGTAPGFNTSNGVHTLNLPLASTGSVTAGLLSNADYTTFTNKMNATSAAVISALGYTPASSTALVSFLQIANNLSDIASATVARINLGLGSLATKSQIDLSSTDVSGTLSAANLSDSGVTAATYTKVSVDNKGRVTSGSQFTASDVATALGYTPANSATVTSSQWDTSGTTINYMNGNVGIGTTAPGAPLSFADSKVTKIQFNGNNANGYQIGLANSVDGGDALYKFDAGLTSAGEFGFYSAGTSKMFISSAGNVGIGTTSPAEKLDVSGRGRFSTTNAHVFKVTGVGPGYADAIDGVATIYSENTAGSGGNILKLGSAFAPNTFVAKDNGNIGIGTTSPGAPLAFADSLSDKIQINGNAANSYKIAKAAPVNSGDSLFKFVAGATAAGEFGFYNGTNLSMLINSSGNVGIGTTTPVTKLEVSGAIRISMDSATCSAGYAGSIRYNSGSVEMCNGTAWSAFGVAGASIANLNGSVSGTQTFATGISGTVFNISSSNGIHTFNIPLAAAGSVTAGLLSNSDYVIFTNKLNATSAAVISALGYTPANPSGSIKVTGQIAAGSQVITGGTASIDWNLGNIISTDYDCSSSLSFANLVDGGTYTLAITSTGTTQCNFSTTTTGVGAGTVSYRFKPANAARTASSHTIYTLMRVGSVVYVSWTSGF